MGQKISIPSKFKFDSHIIRRCTRHRDVAMSITTRRNPSGFCPLSLHQNTSQCVHLSSSLSCPRALASLHHLLALSTRTCQIYAPLTPLAPFSIHEGLSTRARTTRKAGCIERERSEVEKKRERMIGETGSRMCGSRTREKERKTRREKEKE